MAIITANNNNKKKNFSVYREGKLWHDFKTGDGGDVIDFLMLAKGISKGEAIRELIRLAGIPSGCSQKGTEKNWERNPGHPFW